MVTSLRWEETTGTAVEGITAVEGTIAVEPVVQGATVQALVLSLVLLSHELRFLFSTTCSHHT